MIINKIHVSSNVVRIGYIELAGAMHGDDGLVATFKTEKIYARAWMELDNAVRSAMKEAELFIQGKRAQMTLDIEAETPAPKLKGGVA